MGEPPDWPYSILDEFAQFNPSDADINSVIKTYQDFKEKGSSDDAIPVPFQHADLTDAYVIWTPDYKWRILLRKHNPKGFALLGIEPETGI